MINAFCTGSIVSDSKKKLCLSTLFVAAALVAGVCLINNALESKDRFSRFRVVYAMKGEKSNTCKNQCRPLGSEVLPKGIIAKEVNFQMLPLWGSTMKNGAITWWVSYLSNKVGDSPCYGSPVEGSDWRENRVKCEKHSKRTLNLLALAVGIKQKEIVNQIVKKFPSNQFVVMLFHYDGFVDEWTDLAWKGDVIHISAANQTKWWFAKRFLHPDIVAEYNYIFLWDEDIGVENFHPKRYLSIIKKEGLEVSQPALDPTKSKVHQPLTARRRRSRVHRRYYNLKGSGRCDENSTAPPCIGWVEMMAPVFSREAWRCVWYMIQNDLIHAWGLDRQLGYCAQGDRTKNIGVVDSEYIVHLGLPTLGASDENESTIDNEASSSSKDESSYSETIVPSSAPTISNRAKVRLQSFMEMEIFKERWKKAVEEDTCWVDPYPPNSRIT